MTEGEAFQFYHYRNDISPSFIIIVTVCRINIYIRHRGKIFRISVVVRTMSIILYTSAIGNMRSNRAHDRDQQITIIVLLVHVHCDIDTAVSVLRARNIQYI